MPRINPVCHVTSLLLVAMLLRAPTPILAQDAPKSTTAPPATEARKDPPAPTEKHLVLIMVDPEAAQPDLVREIIRALEQRGIGSAKPEAQSPAVDGTERIVLTLSIQPTVQYEKVVALIKDLQELNRTRPLGIAFGPAISKAHGNGIYIAASPKITTNELDQFIGFIQNKQTHLDVHQLALNTRGSSPGTEGTDTTPVHPDRTQQVRVTLLQVKADWSKVKAAKEIEAELRAALKDVSVPPKLLEKLPATAPQILFAPEIVGMYSGDHYAQFLAWLKDRDLIVEATALNAPAALPPTAAGHGPSRPTRPVANEIPRSETMFSKSFESMGLPRTQDIANQPFVTFEPEMRWQLQFVQNSDDFLSVAVTRRSVITEKTRGVELAKITTQSSWDAITYQIPNGHVAITNVFQQGDALHHHETVQRKGFEFILVVENAPAAAEAEPPKTQLHLPDKVETLRRGFNNGFFSVKDGGIEWRGGRAPTGAAAMPPATAAAHNPPTTPKLVNGEGEIKIFSLQYVDATEAASLVKQLLASEQLVLVPDPSKNQVFSRGPNEVMMKVEALMLRLDEPAPAKKPPPNPLAELKSTGTATTVLGVGVAALGELKAKYEAAEKKAAQIAGDVRRQQAQLPPDIVKQLRTTLRIAVSAAFAARQALLQTEALELQQRTLRLQQSLELRNRIQDQIIDRRVDDLLNPDRQWEASLNTAAPIPSANLIPPKTSTAKPALNPPRMGNADQAGNSPPKNSLDRTTRNSAPEPLTAPLEPSAIRSPDRTLILRNAEEYRKLLDDAEAALVSAKKRYTEVLNELQEKNPQAGEAEVQKHWPDYFTDSFKNPPRLRLRLQLIHSELEAQIQLLQVELKDATSELANAEQKRKRISELVKRGAATVTEAEDAVRSVDEAQRRVEWAETLLSLYLKVDPKVVPTP